MKRLTHVRYRQAIKNNKKLILTGILENRATMETDRYHKSRALLGAEFPTVERIFPFIRDLNERKTYNPAYPLTTLQHLIDVKCGVQPENGVVIAAMLVAGFKCNWVGNNPHFNVSSASPALK